MKRLKLLAFALTILTEPCLATQKDKRLHGELTPLRTCFNVTHYRISVKVDPFTQKIVGKNIISFNVVSKFKTIQLDFVETMQIDSIIFQNKRISYSHKKNIILIHFSQELLKNDNKQLTVYFSGKPHVAELPPWKGGFVWSKDPQNNDWVGLACEGMGASVWLPCKDHWSDEADSMDMFLTVPEKLIGVSNGKLIGEPIESEGYKTFHWQVKNTINNYNISINIGKYAEIKDTFYGINNLPLTYYVLENNTSKAEQHFKQTQGMLKAFENYFGAYPFFEDGYKLVETPYWGMEHQSCVAYGNNYKNNAFNFDFIIIHESGHEWFANSITASDPADMWIHESFTTYSEALYVEFIYGKDIATEYLKTQRDKIKARRPLQGPRNEFYHGQTDNDIYYKGAWMLHTMRSVMNNDSLWFASLKNLSLHFRHQIVKTEDILTYFNTATNYNWDIFFKQYIYNSIIPELQYKIIVAKNGSKEVKYKWHNTVKGFNMPLKIYTGNDTYIWLKPTSKYQKITLDKSMTFRLATELFLINNKR